MENFLSDLVAHNIQNRTAAVIENGSWALSSGKLMKEQLGKCKNVTVLEETLSIKSALKDDSRAALAQMAKELCS